MKKRFFALLLALAMVGQLFSVGAAAAGQTFRDVPGSHWAYSEVERAFRDGMVQGTSYDPSTGVRRFQPDTILTLGALITMVTNLMYPEEVASAVWSPISGVDITGSEWYAKNYLVAYRHGLLDQTMKIYFNGTTYPQKFDMGQQAFRYQTAILLTNALRTAGLSTVDSAADAEISDWRVVSIMPNSTLFKTSVATVYHYGIMQGVDSTGKFDGWAPITRAQGAAICCRLSDALKNPGASTTVDTGKTGILTGRGDYTPSSGPWSGRDGLTSAYIVESVSQLESAVEEALGNYTKTLMIYTHSDSVMAEIAAYNNATPLDYKEKSYNLAKYWDRYDAVKKNGKDYAEYRFDITYSYFVDLYQYLTGALNEVPSRSYTFYENGVDSVRYYDPQPTLKAYKAIQDTYGVTQSSSDYEKALAIYRYITANFTYDYDYYDIIEGNNTDSTVYDYRYDYPEPKNVNLLLMSGKGVCHNVAETYQALCILFGLRCYYIDGVSGRGVGHAWNMVELDGQWYLCDATWDLQRTPDTYIYFLLSDAEMNLNHTPNSGRNLPSCPRSYGE